MCIFELMVLDFGCILLVLVYKLNQISRVGYQKMGLGIATVAFTVTYSFAGGIGF